MAYLIKLARFIEFSEQKEISNQIQQITNSNILEQNKRILIESKLNKQQLNELNQTHGINSIHEILKEKTTENLKELIEFLIQNAEFNETKIELQKGLPFHSQAIKERLHKKGIKVIKGNKNLIEIKQFQNKIITRIMKNLTLNELQEKPKIKIIQNTVKEKKELIFVLVEPKTKNEVADFMRLSEIFQSKLYLIDSGEHAKQLLSEASERVKSIKSNKIQVQIMDSLEKAIQDYYAVGFSLWGNKSEQKLIELKNKKLALVFGNEKKGLSLDARQKLKEIIQLGPKSSQCMKSSQALAYALALINN